MEKTMKSDRQIHEIVLAAIFVAGLVVTPLRVLNVLPSWAGDGLFLFALLWVSVGVIVTQSDRRQRTQMAPPADPTP